MLSKKLISLFILLIIVFAGYGQPAEKEYGYFIFPINPGVRNTLAGTMGELRSSHFHTGIDIRTGGRQGIPVVAAADGYVSRIRVSGGGYGNALYITHPNGKVTVYGHLKEFNEKIDPFVLKSQYAKKSFELNLFPKPDQFKVYQGDTIALSGNSGSSGGPHLHFDIRDENQNLLNPLHYGFKEVIDTRVPFAKTIAVVPFNIDSRVEGIFGRSEYRLSEKGNEYVLEDTIHAIGELGLELYAWDKMNGTRFKTGINKFDFKLNNKQVFEQVIDTWSFANARSFYQHINYEVLRVTGQRFHKLYIENGNTLKFYNQLPDSGHFIIEEGKHYNASISLTDSYGNLTTVRLVIKGSRQAKKNTELKETPNSVKIVNNTLRIVSDSLSGNLANLMINDTLNLLKSDFTSQGYPVFLWDLRNAIPKSVALKDTLIETGIISMIPPKQEFTVFNSHTDIRFSRRSLFDTLYLKIKYREDTTIGNEVVTIGCPQIPLKNSITVLYKPQRLFESVDHRSIYQVWGNKNYAYVGGEWKGNQIEFRTRSFGDFTILEDTEPPTIKPLIINRKKLVFELNDKLSGLKEIKATLNGEWLLIAKDPKKKLYWAERQFEDQKYSGDLILEVTDNANNTKTYKTTIK